MHRRSSTVFVSLLGTLACLLCATGCSGTVSDEAPAAGGADGGAGGSPGGNGGAGGTVFEACEDAPAAWPALRRLSTDELANTLRDLLALDERPELELPADDQREGFSNDADLLRASAAFVSSFEHAAFGLAEKAATQRSRYLTCAAGKEDTACVKAFVKAFGRRAFRRPLEEAEVDAFATFFAQKKSEVDADGALALTLSAFLQSPEFLYRNELGEELGLHQLASRLSYTLWQSMPDDELFAAADDGSLSEPGALRTHAERMLKDPKTRSGLAAFHRQWLSLDRVETKTKDTQLFPSWTPELAAAAREESERFAAHVLFEENGSFRDLMTSRTAFVNADLASLYGVEGDGSWRKVELPEAERAGILTRVAFQASRAHSLNGSPILRGIAVMERVTCEHVPMAPDNVNTSNPADGDASNKTNRQLFEERTAPSTCQSCHRVIDPFGYAFEAYDAAGRFRSEEKGQPVDASGTVAIGDTETPYMGPVDFVETLANSVQAQACYGGHWYQFLAGRPLSDEDACRKEGLGKAIGQDTSVLDLLREVVSSAEFTLPGRTAE